MKKIQMVDLKSQFDKIKETVNTSIQEVLETSTYINGPQVHQFQKNLEEYLGVKHVIPCANGTDALQIAMMGLDLKPGDEVITADFTFAATVEVIALLQLTPVLVDVDMVNMNISIEAIKKAITPKTKAIVPVHLFGRAANMEAIMQIAKENNLYVIEDNAQAIGANCKFSDGTKKKAGTIGHVGATSFFPSKNLGCYGDGGAIFTNDDALAHKLRGIVNHGMYVRYHHDVTVYLPLDTKKNAKKFIQLVRPDMVFFIKYEYWPNYLKELKEKQISTFLISGIFRENQLFFKWYGGFYRKALDTFDYFFVQNSTSKELLLRLGKSNVLVSGDTRFDRVVSILEKDNSLDYISEFKNNILTVVIGSSWPKDESILVDFINTTKHKVKFIIAPHNIKAEQIQELKNNITKKVVLFSEKENQNLDDYDVFIIDTVGILTKIYSYADIAYVGGGFGNPGVHNILEPATFGIPIVIGPNFSHFSEATALVNTEGCLSISNSEELTETFVTLIQNEDIRHEKGHICGTFVQMNKGATEKILSYILTENPKNIQ